MPSIEISREQEAYVEALREELADTVTYGHVRTQDALQYLIDHHREDGELDVEVDADIEFDGGEPLDVPPEGHGGDGADPVEEPGPGAGGPADAPGEATPNPDRDADDGGEGTDSPGGATVVRSAGDLGGSGPESGPDGGSGEVERGESDGEVTTAGAPGTLADSGGEKVTEMMNLVEEHDDRWTASDGSGYEVELPDGEVETVRTRDDVRALLFKNYR